MATIPNFAANVTAEELGGALRSAGCAVVHGVFDADVRAGLEAELGPHIETAHPEAGRAMNEVYAAEGGLGYVDFYQGKTRRVISLIKKSPTFRMLALHPITRTGANRSNAVRCGLFVSFSVGWVRQEENHYLEIPVSEVHELTTENARADRLQDAHRPRVLGGLLVALL